MGFTTAKRSWDVERDGQRFHVEMEDEYFLGRRVIRVNGEVAYAGRTVLSDHSGAYQFDLGGRPAFLKIWTNGFRYYYDLVTDVSLDMRAARGPRPADLTQRSPSLGLVAVSFAYAIGIAAVVGVAADGRAWREPIVVVAGVPIDARVTRAIRPSQREGPRIEYRFEVGGSTFAHEGYISQARFDDARARGFVPVRYVAAVPQMNAISPELSDLLVDGFFLALFLGSSALMLKSALAELHDYRVWHRLTRAGVETTGRVSEVRTIRNRYMLVTGCFVEYTYDLAGSDEIRGHSGRFPLSAATRFPRGATVRVRYDPDRPHDSVLLT